MDVDILALGYTAVDDVLYVDHFPSPDSKMPVRRSQRRCGGLAALALIAAARLGASCRFAGVLSEDDELSSFVLGEMSREEIDTGKTLLTEEAGPVHSTIIVDESAGTRAILHDSSKARGPTDHHPDAEIVRGAKVLLVDHLGVSGMIRAARIAREAKIPVVADLEQDRDPQFAELLGLVDHLILSRDFAERITGQPDPARAARHLWSRDRHVVIVTAGRDGCWYYHGAGQVENFPAFAVNVVDTTGCGDVFHGAYCAALAKGMDLIDRLRLASAAAALKASRVDVPKLQEVIQFIEGTR